MNSINENLQKDWERGTFWAGIAFALTFGPMFAIGIVLGWM